MRRLLLLVALVSLTSASCANNQGLVVLTASSLTDVTEALVAASGIDAAVSAAGSQTLVAQVRSGAAVDLVLLADPDTAEALARDGFAGAPTVVATTSLAIAVRADRAAAVTAPVDLARPDLRVVLADADVPLGRYTRDAITRLETEGQVPAGTLRDVLAGADSLEDAARSVLAKVAVGEADAAVVFAADARLAPDLVFVPWPQSVDVRYTVQHATAGRTPDQALAFLAFLETPAADAVWRQFGFAPAD